MKGFFLVLLTNIWIWEILSKNIIIGTFLIIFTIVLYKNINKKDLGYLIVISLILVVIQLLNTKVDLKMSSTDFERYIQIQRTREYPVIPFPLAHWLEERKEVLLFYKLESNFSVAIDPNLYFFANHPRERPAIREFEKYPYILFPLFLVGLYSLYIKNRRALIFLSVLPILLLSIIGNNSWAGPISLFPFFTVTISLGLEKLSEEVGRNAKLRALLNIVYILILIQLISYEIF